MSTLLSVKNVTKTYSNQVGVENISFELKPGQVLGLLGHNGAGKSTLIKSLLGGHSYQGEIEVNGYHPIHQHAELMLHLSYISDVNVLPEWMTVKQLLRYTQGVHPSFNKQKAEQTLSSTNIKLSSTIKQLSKGMKVQLHLAIIIATDTQVLILDEPTLGLDLLYRDTFYRHLLEWFHDGERAMIIASHEVSEIEHLLTDVLILKQGHCVLQKSMEDIENDYFIIELANNHSSEIQKLNPLTSQPGLGTTKWLLEDQYKAQVEPMGTIYNVGLADLFLATQTEKA
ncbi:ABC transporter ATP-binding protein [Vibrio crassostreae]|uniref:ABC transporter ATP-binding protein n=1 Tax=Vibrio crassostreae TaxID=246167 RepID=UPI000F4AE1FB|nr:ABC transporter ATP-binding protein [Vibrio crassostreae]ROS59781.1 ABC-2 type transport system ATP-binding protein [Vibrio crassostreae]RPF14866.1 ABC-2 type transport system ATP-binding protein [Vibrio crassostreae]TCT66491.1 ABC-2 type transport system ATP-binding protein [Vibrio crassostreae]CAK2485538.1 ABC-2 type transport system ATP-binding protein [Vibrio crassostreae]CAK2913385.1 ABC-2 type transport system ATP-binding protein [Vibrio crassostreae]